MPRGRLGQIVHSRKNILRSTQAITGNTGIVIAEAVESPTPSTSDREVVVGSKIFRIWVEVWIYGTLASGVNNPVDWMIYVNPGNNITFPAPSGMTTADDMKKFVIRQGKAILSRLQDGGPPYVIRGWIKIPKQYHRMGLNDRISISIESAGANICTFFVYKYYE